jgi:Tfp pilus tip-associated adhesin PilY1
MNKISCALIISSFLLASSVSYGDETDIFSAVSPDALIILDLSGSMISPPQGWQLYASDCSSNGPFYATSGSGHTNACDTAGILMYGKQGDPTCPDPFYKTTGNRTGTKYDTDCSKLAAAKNAIKGILDVAAAFGTIDSNDETALKVRIGYMHFVNCSHNAPTACISVVNDIPSTDPAPFSSPSRYSDIWNSVSNETANGGTPDNYSMAAARTYLDTRADSARDCRQKFVILITDGADTYDCSGNGTETQSGMYKRRKGTVAEAKALANAGYKVFVVGFGATMPDELKNTLNWAAYFGGTDNPSAPNSGNTGAITVSSDWCNEGSSNDPGNAFLSGYAFIATNPSELTAALIGAFGIIQQAAYSFSVTSVAASRTTAENYLYEASFKPINMEPLWHGFIKQYSLNADGSVGSLRWDGGSMLQSRGSSTRAVLTYREGSVVDIESDSPPGKLKGSLAVGAPEAMAIAGYIKGDPTYNKDNWKLGDIFHSNPVVIGSPSAYFTDVRSPQAFIDFYNSNKGRLRLLVAGANDGQLHAFQAGTSDGSEHWSFVPPNLQPKLQYLAHFNHPTALAHTYFVDGPITVADVWLGSGDGTSKASGDWHTLLVFGEGRGVRDQTNNPSNTSYLWSSSQYCDLNFNNTYTTTYKYYCGYYALDMTVTEARYPVYKWRVNADSAPNLTGGLQYLGEPWSKMTIGRVKINGSEKWVGFIGGGWSPDTTSASGKGFFVVDLSDGNILWSYTKGSNGSMTYSIPASPAVVDTDNDAFIDAAYVGDLGGNVWRFKFCSKADASTCNTSNWSGGKLFDSSVGADSSGNSLIKPIYTTATVARDLSSLWVFWGTGDKEAPKGTIGTDHFFALKDNDRTAFYDIGNFRDITATGAIYDGTTPGWYIRLTGTGEKILFDPTVFGGIVAFTTYTPYSGSNPCEQGGTSNLYAMAMMPLAIDGYPYDPGAGVLTTGSPGVTTGGLKSILIGRGVAKNPVLSQKPLPSGGATDLYVSLSGGGGQDTQIKSSSQLNAPPLTTRLTQTAPSSMLLHWKDGRIQ